MEKNDLDPNINTSSYQSDYLEYSQKPQSNKLSKPFIAGILMIIAGFLAILFWAQIYSIDVKTISSIIDISQLESMEPSITVETFVSFIKSCSIIGFIISIFIILGGILSIKRKLWGIALTCSIIGIFSVGIILTSSIFSFIAMVLLILSRKEY